ncbi:head GIN domain-containing protein [Bacteroides sp.]
MKANLNVLLAILLTSLLTGCTFVTERTEGIKPSKNYITRDYKIKDFSAIDATTVGDIYYTQSTDGKSTLQIYGPDNFVELIQVSVKNNTLVLAMDKRKKIKNAKKLKITVSSPNLNSIQFKGVGNIHIEDPFITGRLDIESKGVGNIQIKNLDCQNLTVSSMGVGNVDLKGKAVNANLITKGVGDIEATELESTHVKASSNGVGNISCNAVQSIDAAVKGVGSINYKGTPAQKTFSKKGVGSIKNI